MLNRTTPGLPTPWAVAILSFFFVLIVAAGVLVARSASDGCSERDASGERISECMHP